MKAATTAQPARTQTLAFLQTPGWPFRRLHFYLVLALPQTPRLTTVNPPHEKKPPS